MTATTLRYGATIPTPRDEAFRFVSDPTTWPRFFVGIESTESGDGWGCAGGQGRMTTRFLGRSVMSTMDVTGWDPARSFRYTARQTGRPDLDNLRVFEPVAGAARLCGTTVLEIRPGPRGLIDRVSARVLQRVHDRAMVRLAGIVAESEVAP